MNFKNDKLRKVILNNDLYEKCNKTQIDKINLEISNRLDELKKYNCTSNCSINDLKKICKSYNSLNNNKMCISESCKNKLYYDEYKESYFYDIIKLDTGNIKDKKQLIKFNNLAKAQNKYFLFPVLDYDDNTIFKYSNNIYYIAYNKKNKIIGGVAKIRLDLFPNLVNINSISTRNSFNKDNLNKGIGNKIINFIIDEYKNNDNFYGIILESYDSSLGFYLKYGFEQLNIKRKDIMPHLIYLFRNYDNKFITKIKKELIRYIINMH